LGDPDRLKYVKAKGATLIARMDMDAFAIAMRNLLDNAAKHGPAGGVVELWLEPGNVIRVINDGPVVAPEMLAKLKQRFARGQSRTEGAGLGLAIVDTIMNQAMGKLELISPATGKDSGFEARLSLNKRKV
jgi:two-component system, OmpR family, sensor kinase